jgi:hypothetical protein
MPGEHRPRQCDAGHPFYVDDTQIKAGHYTGTRCLVQVTIETDRIRVKKTFCSLEHFKLWAKSNGPERETQV